MNVESEISLPLARPSILTIGVFDGVHLGHRHLIDQMVTRARELQALSAVVTLHPHPREILQQRSHMLYLSSLKVRNALLRASQVDLVATLHFTKEVSLLSAEEFLTFLHRTFRMHELWTGPDFALGHGRSGTLPVIQAVGERLGYDVRVVEPLEVGGAIARSSVIRQFLGEGNVAEAARLLGRPYELEGRVTSGVGRGRQLGFPTANLEVDAAQVMPGNGVYCVYAGLNDGQRRLAVTNIGVRPSFGAGPRTIEVHILGFDQDLYQQAMRVEFLERLRDEQRFGSIEELKAQIDRDIQRAVELAREDPDPRRSGS